MWTLSKVSTHSSTIMHSQTHSMDLFKPPASVVLNCPSEFHFLWRCCAVHTESRMQEQVGEINKEQNKIRLHKGNARTTMFVKRKRRSQRGPAIAESDFKKRWQSLTVLHGLRSSYLIVTWGKAPPWGQKSKRAYILQYFSEPYEFLLYYISSYIPT